MRKFHVAEGFEGKAVLPTRKTKNSCGYDISIIIDGDLVIEPQESYVFDTGISVELNSDEYLALHVRSSIGIGKKLVLSNTTGIIDSDFYPNPIKISLTNIGNEPQILSKGVLRVAQGIICKYLTVDDEEEITKERVGGIGSTGT